MPKHILAIMFSTLLLAACASVPLEKQTVTVQDDQFSHDATIVGTKLFENPFGGIFKEWFLRSFVDKKTGAVTHQLYVNTHYLGEWHFYDSAADDTATSLRFIPIGREVGDCHGLCDFDETFGLMLDDDVLRNRASTGFKVKVSAKDGSAFILTIPPGQIQPQLAAVDGYRASHQLQGAASNSNQLPPHPVLGIKILPTPAPLASMLGIKGGLLIATVTPQSPADRAGLKPGDVILTCNGKSIDSVGDLQSAIGTILQGDTMNLAVRRGRSTTTLPVKF